MSARVLLVLRFIFIHLVLQVDEMELFIVFVAECGDIYRNFIHCLRLLIESLSGIMDLFA